jgi:caffeoyl-CoA O-methyltransferase
MSAPEPRHDLDFSLMREQVTADAVAYADTHTTSRSDDERAVAEETLRTAAVPQMMGGAVEARLLEALAVATQARAVLEIGTFTGTTTVALAQAVGPGGHVTTIEFDPELAATAQRNIDASQVANRIDLIVGDAREVLGRLDGPFELVFIDAWKQHYVDYYESVLPRLADHGLIVADNVIWGGLPFHPDAQDGETEGVRRFVAHVQADPRTHNALLTVGDGLLLIWKATA